MRIHDEADDRSHDEIRARQEWPQRAQVADTLIVRRQSDLLEGLWARVSIGGHEMLKLSARTSENVERESAGIILKRTSSRRHLKVEIRLVSLAARQRDVARIVAQRLGPLTARSDGLVHASGPQYDICGLSEVASRLETHTSLRAAPQITRPIPPPSALAAIDPAAPCTGRGD